MHGVPLVCGAAPDVEAVLGGDRVVRRAARRRWWWRLWFRGTIAFKRSVLLRQNVMDRATLSKPPSKAQAPVGQSCF